MNQLERDVTILICALIIAMAPTEKIDVIPKKNLRILESAFFRYEHFIHITCGYFPPEEIATDREKYPHLLRPLKNGLPVFCDECAAEYMTLITELPIVQCAVFIYHHWIETARLGVYNGAPNLLIKESYEIMIKQCFL